MAAVGKRLFFDATLSGSGKLSCASCHDPAHAYGPPDRRSVRLGGPGMDRAAARAVPSLRYKSFTPLFQIHYYIGRGEDMEDEGPTGGFMSDGRASSLAEQAALPLLDPLEMANESKASVVVKLAAAPYADAFKKVFGAHVFDDVATAFRDATLALQSFQQEDPSFQPYSSKYDRYLRHEVKLSPHEENGLVLFNRTDKGNCAKCHPSWPGANKRPPQFTDFGLAAIGVPRNPDIPVNRDPTYFDLGVCGPLRHDLAAHEELCGLFKTPTLRNVATRQVFFHNGRYHTLDEVMHFYVERDTDPGRWYPRVHGKVVKFDDLPDHLRQNADTHTAPFDRHPGQAPALSKSEIADIEAFLQALTDSDVAASPPG
jgi:cytochrome c peroxidase